MSFDFKQFVIQEGASIKHALVQIEINHSGLIFTVNDNDEVIGLATDGDIRRALMLGKTLDDPISLCANADFIWAHSDTPRLRSGNGISQRRSHRRP